MQVVQKDEEPKFVTLDEIDDHNKPNEKVETLPQQEIQTPPIVVRRSSRISKPLECYSPSLYYMLYTNNGEFRYFDEAM